MVSISESRLPFTNLGNDYIYGNKEAFALILRLYL